MNDLVKQLIHCFRSQVVKEAFEEVSVANDVLFAFRFERDQCNGE